jgi:hypothetical protein
MNKGVAFRNVAVMMIFAGLGLTQFTENVRTVQVLGLFASGMVCGVALGMLIITLKAVSKQE